MERGQSVSFLVVRCRRCRRVVDSIRQPETMMEEEGYWAAVARWSSRCTTSSISRGPVDVPGCSCYSQSRLFPETEIPLRAGAQCSLFGG
jgi:hypothetical protein